jgi:phosphinothricin acetyltransferase
MPHAGGCFAATRPRPSSRNGRDAIVARVEIHDARDADLEQIAAIWNHEVLCSEATTDTEPRDAAAQREWLARHPEAYPAIVVVVGEEVVAYGSLSPYRPKPAFARTVEDSVYVKRGRRGAGLGSLVVAELIRRAEALGHHSILARITATNVASLRLHERHGFHPVGVEHQSAFKLGHWHDVTIMQRRIDAV